MRKILVLLLLLLATIGFAACKNKEQNPFYICVNGDITNSVMSINIYDIEKQSVSLTDNGKQKEYQAYSVSSILEKVSLLNTDNYLLFTSYDGVSARIKMDGASLCYLFIEEGKVNIKAPYYPPVVGIKDLMEITVISKIAVNDGIRIVSEQGVEILSRGQFRLSYFEQVSQTMKNDNVAYKHIPIVTDRKLSLIADTNNSYLYDENSDVLQVNDDNGILIWERGKIVYENGNEKISSLLGIVIGATKLIYDAYFIMKQEIDSGNKVMLVLPDGFSYEQRTYYHDQLGLFASSCEKAASVNPAISNVALASIITGVSPHHTGITERGIKKPQVQDIFDYALSKGKSVKYIEGNSNLVITDIEPIFNAADPTGSTDYNVFNSTLQALQANTDVIFTHFHGIDDINHEYSPISDNAKTKILEIENYITQLMENFEGTVIIVPDHGAITYTDNEQNKKGRHGYFEDKDMYVPFYVFSKEEDR